MMTRNEIMKLFKPYELSDDERTNLVYEFFDKREKNQRPYSRKYWIRNHPEDLYLDDENMRAREQGYDDDGLRSLMAAICLRACSDYQRAIKGRSYEPYVPPYIVQVECREFFDSDMMQFFTNGMDVKEIESFIKKLPPKQNIATIWRKMEK